MFGDKARKMKWMINKITNVEKELAVNNKLLADYIRADDSINTKVLERDTYCWLKGIWKDNDNLIIWPFPVLGHIGGASVLPDIEAKDLDQIVIVIYKEYKTRVVGL